MVQTNLTPGNQIGMILIFIVLVIPSPVMSQQASDSGYPPIIPGARAETYKTVGDIDLQVWIFSPADHNENHQRP
ncbi:hypothetical protein KA005_54290, partial [bacterium]|nr:hypothetical protein [bacterium]